MPSAVGLATGVMSVSPATSAILIDHPQVYMRTIRGSRSIYGGEYTGLPGFRFVVAKIMDVNLLFGLIPPYPQAVTEAIIELYLMGIKNFIVISRGSKLGKKSDNSEKIILAKAAIPVDGVSERLAPRGTPLLASAELLRAMLTFAEMSGLRGKVHPGITVTLPTVRAPWSYEMAEEYVGLRDVWAADSVTAPLYALQYYYGRVNTLSIIVTERVLFPAQKPVETDARTLERISEREIDLVSNLVIASAETIKNILGE